VLFLGAHIFKAKIEPNVIHDQPEPFSDMADRGPTLAVYVPACVTLLTCTLQMAPISSEASVAACPPSGIAMLAA
jgi:hypothetical protein